MDYFGLKLSMKLQENLPTILFIPGNMCCPAVFDYVNIPEGVQGAVIDWAMSDGPWDIEQLGIRIGSIAKENNLGKTIIAGYSVGGVLAMLAALHAREKVAGLLLSNTGASTIGHGDPNFPQRILEHWGTEELTAPFLARAFARTIPVKLEEQTKQYYHDLNKEAVYQAAYSLRQTDISERIKNINCHVTIAHGSLDTSRTPEHAKELKRLIPHAKLVWLDGGHSIMVEDSTGWQNELNELIMKITK